MALHDPRVTRSRTRALDVGRRLLVSEGLDAVTHLRIADAGGGARRTLYRRWPDPRALLHDVLAHGEVPTASRTFELRADLIAHLAALHSALTRGHLGLVVCALGERAAVDPTFEPLRRDLTDAGCAPLRTILADAVTARDLPTDLDRAAAMGLLEGPVFYCALIRRKDMTADHLASVVDRFLDRPPLRDRPTVPVRDSA